MSVLEVDNLTKTFGGLVAVDDFSLEVDEGEIVGLIGRTGRESRRCSIASWACTT